MSHELIIYNKASCPNECRKSPSKRGFYKHQNSRIQRWHCPECGKSFSDKINSDTYRERLTHLRRNIFFHFVNRGSQRRLAISQQIHRKTVVAYFIKIGKLAHHAINFDNLALEKSVKIQFDDMETFCHTKCKPLSISLAVEGATRRILGIQVSQMPAKGKLIHIALKKYGPRADLRSEGRDYLFKRIKNMVADEAEILSDKNPHYANDIKKHFPKATHYTVKGIRGCVTGQGELKATSHDPLFSLNHTCAMFRDNINRLSRRTWNTTKSPERLSLHLAIYALFHNRWIIKNKSI